MLMFEVAFPLISNINQYSCLSVEQPFRVDFVLYKPHWEFPINKKIIPMLTCPVAVIIH